MNCAMDRAIQVPWYKGKIMGQKAPLKLKDIWAIRIRLQLGHRTRAQLHLLEGIGNLLLSESALLHNMIPFSIGEKSCRIFYF